MAEEVEDDVLTVAQFLDLPVYSCTLPDGTTIGKKWARDINEPKRFHGPDKTIEPEWWTGEYIPSNLPGMVGIKWRRVKLVSK